MEQPCCDFGSEDFNTFVSLLHSPREGLLGYLGQSLPGYSREGFLGHLWKDLVGYSREGLLGLFHFLRVAGLMLVIYIVGYVFQFLLQYKFIFFLC